MGEPLRTVEDLWRVVPYVTTTWPVRLGRDGDIVRTLRLVPHPDGTTGGAGRLKLRRGEGGRKPAVVRIRVLRDFADLDRSSWQVVMFDGDGGDVTLEPDAGWVSIDVRAVSTDHGDACNVIAEWSWSRAGDGFGDRMRRLHDIQLRPDPPAAPAPWQYAVHPQVAGALLPSLLDSHGAQGWQVVSINPVHGPYAPAWHVVFGRPRTGPQDAPAPQDEAVPRTPPDTGWMSQEEVGRA